MKAHEQDWIYDKDSGEIRYVDKPDVPLDFFADEEAGKLAAAAPKMARALALLYNEARGLSLNTSRTVRAALREAGVPLPF